MVKETFRKQRKMCARWVETYEKQPKGTGRGWADVSRFCEWNAGLGQTDSWPTDCQKTKQKTPHSTPSVPPQRGVLLGGTYTSRRRGQPVCSISAPDSFFVPLLVGRLCSLTTDRMSPLRLVMFPFAWVPVCPSVPSVVPSPPFKELCPWWRGGNSLSHLQAKF